MGQARLAVNDSPPFCLQIGEYRAFMWAWTIDCACVCFTYLLPANTLDFCVYLCFMWYHDIIYHSCYVWTCPQISPTPWPPANCLGTSIHMPKRQNIPNKVLGMSKSLCSLSLCGQTQRGWVPTTNKLIEVHKTTAIRKIRLQEHKYKPQYQSVFVSLMAHIPVWCRWLAYLPFTQRIPGFVFCSKYVCWWGFTGIAILLLSFCRGELDSELTLLRF